MYTLTVSICTETCIHKQTRHKLTHSCASNAMKHKSEAGSVWRWLFSCVLALQSSPLHKYDTFPRGNTEAVTFPKTESD